MSKFQEETSKGMLKESMEEGNAFTAALAKAKKGEKVKVDGEEITDTSNYDDPSVKEYSYTDNYPGSWGYKEGEEKEDDVEEGLHTPPLQATEPTVDVNEEEDSEVYIPNEDNFKVKIEDKIYTAQYHNHEEGESIDLVSDDGDKIEGKVKEVSPDGDLTITLLAKEGLHMPPLQATGQSLKENTVANPPYGFDVLSPDERKQLKEYIDSIKTIQKEIARLAAKAGKKVKVEGGDMTGRMMTPSVTSEGASREELESRIHPTVLDALERVVYLLYKTGLNAEEVKALLNAEADDQFKTDFEKKGEEAVKGQYDIGERSYAVSKNAVPAYTLKAGDIITSGEEIVSVSAGAMTPGGKVEVTLKNPVTGKTRGAVWGKHTMIGKKPKAE